MKYIVWRERHTNKYWAAGLPDGSRYSVFMPPSVGDTRLDTDESTSAALNVIVLDNVRPHIVVSKGQKVQDHLKGAFVAEVADICSARSLVTKLRKVAKVMES